MILEGDCVEKMREMDEASVDAIVTDPPYHLTFMGRAWDHAPSPAESQEQHHAWAVQALRILKPGGHLLAFGGTRTYHRLACAIEDAGFEIRDCLVWMYGSGFPKSLDVSKAIDKRGGANIAWFGPWLKEERERRGITRKELAVHFPSQQSYAGKPAKGGLTGCVGNWETGVSLPTNEQFNKLCEVLDLPFDRMEEAEGEYLRTKTHARSGGEDFAKVVGSQAIPRDEDLTAPATPEAAQWEGWGTALKPAHEPIVLARKPLVGTVAANVLEHGTGALNIDGCRIGFQGEADERESKDKNQHADFGTEPGGNEVYGDYSMVERKNYNPPGRWPANVALSHLPECVAVGTRKVKGSAPASGPTLTGESKSVARGKFNGVESTPSYPEQTVTVWECAEGCPIAMLDEQSGELTSGSGKRRPAEWQSVNAYGFSQRPNGASEYERDGDSGGASRFFYCAKSSRGERNAGLDGFEERPVRPSGSKFGEQTMWNGENGDSEWRAKNPNNPAKNVHPTVKPIDLMRWLVRLVTPPGGTVLDPFAGSGTTGIAAVLEGFNFLGIEREREYAAIARARIEWWSQFPGESTEDILVRAGLSERIEREHQEAGQLGIFEMAPEESEPVDGNREGEATAEKRYTDSGSSNFAMKPGRRRKD